MPNEQDPRRPFFIVPESANTGPEHGIPPEEFTALARGILQSTHHLLSNRLLEKSEGRSGKPIYRAHIDNRLQVVPAMLTQFTVIVNRRVQEAGPLYVAACYFMDELDMNAQPTVHRCVVTEDDTPTITSYTFGQDAVTPNGLADAEEWRLRDMEEILLPDIMTPTERLQLPPIDGAQFVRWSGRRMQSILLEQYTLENSTRSLRKRRQSTRFWRKK